MTKIKKNIFNYWQNLQGWSVDDKIVVFESDDWGSTRMPSKRVYEILLKSNLRLDNCPYSQFDSLENTQDIETLCNTLKSIRDHSGNHPIFTCNFLVANPQIEKIFNDGSIQGYFFESIEETYNRYGYKSKIVIDEAIDNSIIEPQFHGREHINIEMWLFLLKSNKTVLEAAQHGLFQLSFTNLPTIQYPYLAAFYPFGNNYFLKHKEILESGMEMFLSTFHTYPTSFIPPVYFYYQGIEDVLLSTTIKSFQGLYKRHLFKDGKDSTKFARKITKNGMVNLVRNCFFEPSTANSKDWVSEVLKEIETAFIMKKPAIICTHRLNYIGSLDESNRKKSNELLFSLLKKMLTKWPDIKFMSDSQLVHHLTKQ
jgi:hypothetical protein